MAAGEQDWKPGSFTKNFSWGPPANGLLELYESIRIGFDNQMEDVPQSEHSECSLIDGLGTQLKQ